MTVRGRLAVSMALAVAALMARPVGAQQTAGMDTAPVPAAYRPPPGMCRIWLDDVPPARQPAPTDCATAVRERPANGRVVFGERLKDAKADDGARPSRDPARCVDRDGNIRKSDDEAAQRPLCRDRNDDSRCDDPRRPNDCGKGRSRLGCNAPWGTSSPWMKSGKKARGIGTP